MPQNAHIVAGGGGDYTTIIAWEAGEQDSDYGATTVGRVDGFFDQGGSALAIGGTWTNGARLEPFDSADGFDGTERQLCGLTSSNNSRALRTLVPNIIIDGLEIYCTATGTGRGAQSNVAGSLVLDNCLVKVSCNKLCENTVTNNTVLVNTKVSTVDPITGTNTFNNTTVFFDSTDNLAQANTLAANDTVVSNDNGGDDFDASVTQSNNASTDTTADNLTNIVIATEFVDATPVASGDYRIKAGSDLDTNGIGAFIQTAGGISVTVTGTAVPTQTEADIVTGGKTIILTLTGDTFVTGTSSEDGIAGGSDSDIAASGTNWDSLIKTALDNTDVVLSVGDTVATITLPAFATYDIPTTETITWTIPAASLTTSATPVIATPTHTVTAVVSGFQVAWAIHSNKLINMVQ